MQYLLVKEKGQKKHILYSTATFGSDTWGSTSQVSLIKKKKYWYVNHWTAENDWVEDSVYEYKLNVVKETADLDEIIHYLAKHSPKEIKTVIEAAKELYDDYISMTLCFLDRD